jgi:hypothetical protein
MAALADQPRIPRAGSQVSRTVHEMLFGATIATAGLWVLAATVMLLRK